MRTLVAVVAILSSQQHAFFFKVEAASLSSKKGDYPFHDAMIAAGFLTPSRKFGLDEMRSVLNCSHGEEAVQQFETQIPEIIDKALRKAEYDYGRITEYVEDVFEEVGDNSRASIKAVTLSCTVIQEGGFGLDVSGAAYATHMVASGTDVIPDDADTQAYNVSSVMPAEVMELPAGGYVFVPKLYCLGDLDKQYDLGVNLGGSDTIAGTGTARINRPVSLGTREEILQSAFNRVTWLSVIANDTITNLIRNAYEFPTPEFLGVLEVLDEKLCSNVTETNGTFAELQDCIRLQTTANLASQGIETDDNVIDLSLHQVGSMINMQENWVDWKIRTHDLSDQLNYNDDFFQKFSQQTLDSVKGSFPVTPFTFDRRLALSEKTSPLLKGYQINPFLSPDQVSETLSVSNTARSDVVNCVQQKVGDTTVERAAAFNFLGTLRRREKEHIGSPRERVADWSHYNGRLGFTAITELYNIPHMGQNVSWKENKRDGTFDLLPGNLTERRLGLTHHWVMTTKWNDETQPLQGLLQAQRDSKVYSIASNAASVTNDNICSNAASNAEIFWFIVALAIATFGGVNAALRSVHQACHWWVNFCCSFGMIGQQQGSLPCRSSVIHHSGWKRLIPTYDLLLVLIGMAVFVSLYTPLLLQLAVEFKVANYSAEAVAMEVNYAPASIQFSDQPSYSVLVTLVHSQTGCTKARQELLLIVLIVGLTFGVLINAPYIPRARQAFGQYFCCRSNISKDGRDVTLTSILQSEPKILKACTFDNFRSSCNTVEDSSRNDPQE